MKRQVQFAAFLLLAACCFAGAQQQPQLPPDSLPAPPADLLPPKPQPAQPAAAAGQTMPQQNVAPPASPQPSTPQSSLLLPSSSQPSSSQIAPLPVDAPPATPQAPSESGAAAEPSEPQLKLNPLEALRNFEPSPDEEYRLGRGDEITVDFPGRPDLEAKLVIGPDGRITLPLAGDLMLADLTRAQAAQAIQTVLAPYYENLAVQVTVTKYTSNRVLVLGAVTTPGEYNFDGTPTLLEALTRAGLVSGPDKIARIPEQCAIYRGSDQVVWVQLKELIESGNTLADLRLRRNDVIYVPNMAERFVSVLGEVQHPGAIPLTSSSTIASVLAEAGGLTDMAGSNAHIQIVDSSTGTSRVISFKELLHSAQAREIALKPGDIVFVPKTGFSKVTYVFQRLNPIFALSTLAYLGAIL